MSKISAIIIAKDAENAIADCIDSLSFADEIVLINNVSSDRTADIAKLKGAKVFDAKVNSFSELRNIGAIRAKYEWIFYIDADERVSRRLMESIKEIIDNNEKHFSAYKIMRKNYYFGKYEWPVIEKLERLFIKKELKEWYGDLHESPRVSGEIGEINEGYLLHFTHKDLTSMLAKTIEWSRIEAELRYKANHPKVTWWRFPRVMISVFYDSYIKQKGYKIGTVGIIESIFQAFSIFITYARLWEMQTNKQKD